MNIDLNSVHLAVWLLAGMLALPITLAAIGTPAENTGQSTEAIRRSTVPQLKENMSQRVYKVDKFVVPDSARDAFIDKVQAIHELLRTQPGFIQDFILEQSSGPGNFNFVTIVVWKNPAALEGARAAVAERRERTNFNPKEFVARLGIKADVATYTQVGAQ